jgi:hypothetical protein
VAVLVTGVSFLILIMELDMVKHFKVAMVALADTEMLMLKHFLEHITLQLVAVEVPQFREAAAQVAEIQQLVLV